MIKTKVLNFTAQEILPKLLDRTKIQTIRPGWKKPELVSGISINGNPIFDKDGENPYIEKPSRFEPGETIQIMWSQRSKHQFFCINCGKGVDLYPGENYPKRGLCCTNHAGSYKYFPKIIGKAKINTVLKDGIYKDSDGKFHMNAAGFELAGGDVEKIAKMDGFKSAGHMFIWLDDRYDLSTPREFWIYRWRWLQ